MVSGIHRYKESISKGIRSLEEKILVCNSIKEQSKGGGDDAYEKSPVNGKATQEGPTNHESSYPENVMMTFNGQLPS
ncbi:hypothetical protein SAY87_007929 [Trapa incisa]|uniref:Uncharacterized protein n=1 Tax=Trapa incisa TaxID=236973 RepID=A0AAN7KHC9_9MYRT|nr:hypothetical protein SAY87_007929 [Trapa incisa]